jgi:hypothetical protein
MKRISILAIVAAGLACGGSSPSKPPPFTKPAGTVAVGFSVDDTANKVYADKDLEWKGSMVYDASSNKAIYDSTWGAGNGPFAPMYDDGPFSKGGHEPENSVAGDHIFGVVIFVTPPATGTQDYNYGLSDSVYQTKFGNGWVWPNANPGTFTVAAGATADIKADGIALKKFGTTDLQLTIDGNNLVTSSTWDKSKVTVKGSAWAWSEVTLTNDGTGKFVFTLSNVTGAGKQFPHTGLTNSGDKAQFVFVFNNKEYKDAAGAPSPMGVSAAVKAAGATSWTPVAVANQPSGDKNTYVTIP